jgi:hypothetical protein
MLMKGNFFKLTNFKKQWKLQAWDQEAQEIHQEDQEDQTQEKNLLNLINFSYLLTTYENAAGIINQVP